MSAPTTHTGSSSHRIYFTTLRYLLDANVLIDADKLYYSIDRVPEYWAWLLHHASAGHVKVPIEIYNEVKVGKDRVAKLVRQERSRLVLQAQVSAASARTVLNRYGKNLTAAELQKIGQDPFLIAHAASNPNVYCIVTTEVSAVSKRRANRKIPDVAAELKTCDPFQFIRRLDFSTSWVP